MLSVEFILTSFIVVLIPGTGVIYTISNGLFLGWRASIVAAIGCTAGIIPHLLATILGLATLLHLSAVAFQFIKFIGVAYLFYLAWSMWKDTGTLKLQDQVKRLSYWQIATKGFLINILNPKLSIFFLAFLPQFVPAHEETPILNMLVLSITFMIMTFGIFVLYGLFANSMRTYVLHSPRILKRVQRSFAITFAMLGTKLAFTDK